MKQFDLGKAIEELESIEREFAEPALDLERALASHARARKLAKAVSEYLDAAESTLERQALAHDTIIT